MTIHPKFGGELFCYLLQNNLKVIILLMIGSLFFGSITALNLLLDGCYVGSTIKLSLKNYATSKVVYLILPHGIFEIPAIIIAGAASFKIPYEIVRYLAGKKETVLTREDIKEYLTLALISVILVVIAAWIEANVTLKIDKAMLNSI